MSFGKTLLGLAGMAARRPRTGWALARAAWRFRARDWYRRPPFLPLPPSSYIAWRLHTAYGDETHLPDADELQGWLDWVRRMG